MTTTSKVQPPKETRRFVSSGPVGKSRVKKAGGSLITTIPAAARKLARLEDGQEMAFSVEGRKIIMEPVEPERPARIRRPRYTLDELIAQSDDGDRADTDQVSEWQEAPPVGREIW